MPPGRAQYILRAPPSAGHEKTTRGVRLFDTISHSIMTADLQPSPSTAELSPRPAVGTFTFTGAQPAAPRAPPAAAKPKHGKRYRPPGPPFHDKLYAQSGRQISVVLEVPAPGEECPLTLSPMEDDVLHFLQPTTTWYSAFPSVKKITLPCGHSFGALNLLYHFARRNMLCPCCRSGLDSPLTISSVPAHFRMNFSTKVSRERSADAEEMSAENARAAARLQLDDPSGMLQHGDDASMTLVFSLEPVDYITAGMTMSMEFYSRDSNAPRGAIVVPMLPTWQTMRHIFDYQLQGRPIRTLDRMSRGAHGSGDENSRADPGVNSPRHRNVFAIPTGHIRSLLDDQLRDPSVHQITLSAIFDGPPNPYQGQLARTEPIILNRSENRTVRRLETGNGSMFVLETLMGDSEIMGLTWSMPDDFLMNRAFP